MNVNFEYNEPKDMLGGAYDILVDDSVVGIIEPTGTESEERWTFIVDEGKFSLWQSYTSNPYDSLGAAQKAVIKYVSALKEREELLKKIEMIEGDLGLDMERLW